MDKDIRTYLKIYKDWIPSDICKETVAELEKVEGQFQTHQFYDSHTGGYHSYEHELSVTWSNVKHKDLFMKRIWEGLQQYMNDFQFSWYSSWNGYSEIRFNRYRPDTQMKLHCDHIHSMFDGQRKGIPSLTILGALNNDYVGGELVFWEDSILPLKEGEIMIFPSNFMYPHRVDPVKKGARYSYVACIW